MMTHIHILSNELFNNSKQNSKSHSLPASDRSLPEIYADMPYFKSEAPFKDVAQFMAWFNDLTPYEQSVFITLLDRAHNYTLMYFSQNSLRSYHAHEKKISLRSVQDYMKKFRDEGVVYTVNRQTSQDKAQGIYETNLTYLHEIFRTDEFVGFIRSLCKRLKWYGFSFFKASLLASSITALQADFVLINKGIHGTVNSLARNKGQQGPRWQESYGLQMLKRDSAERYALTGTVQSGFYLKNPDPNWVCSVSYPEVTTPAGWDYKQESDVAVQVTEVISPSPSVLPVLIGEEVHKDSLEYLKTESRLPLTLKGMMKLSVFPVSVLKELETVKLKLDADNLFNWIFAVGKKIAVKTGTEPLGFALYDKLMPQLDLVHQPYIDADKFQELKTKKTVPKTVQEYAYSAGSDKWGTKRPETIEEMEAVRLETIKKLEDMQSVGTLNVFAQLLLDNFKKNDPSSPANPLIADSPTKAQIAHLLGKI